MTAEGGLWSRTDIPWENMKKRFHVHAVTLLLKKRKPESEDFDERLVGLSVKEMTELTLSEPDAAFRRSYFSTKKLGKSNTGHDYPAVLTDPQRKALLEYLKTL